MLQNNSPNSHKKFLCKTCDYGCSKKSDFDKHLSSNKHKGNEDCNKCNTKIAVMVCDNCNKIYKSRVGLWRHKKLCIIQNNTTEKNKIEFKFLEKNYCENIVLDASSNEIKILTNLVLEVMKNNNELLKQNQEFQKQTHEMQKEMMELYKQGNTVNNNHSNNKTFNLNFFLNEQCKDAMNIMDFVDTFQLQFDDLERIGEVGYVEGISNLIIDKLNGMDIYKRPIHCSDAKREIMHIKDNGVWEKDNENNDKLRLAIKHITKKNIDLIGSWTEKYPGVRYSDHRLNDKFNEIIMEAMGGKNNKTMKEGEGKIIKKISKMVLINKNI
jgi:hypothetical protein